MVQCSGDSGQTELDLKLRITSLETESQSSNDFMFTSSSTPKLVHLRLDKSAQSYFQVSKTNTCKKVCRTERITDSVFYHSYLPKQFKTINEFRGSIVNTNQTNNAFVRAVVHFVECGHPRLFALVRNQKNLYQIRPLLDTLESGHRGSKKQNIHEVFLINENIKTTIFTSKSKTIERKSQKPLENYYCCE